MIARTSYPGAASYPRYADRLCGGLRTFETFLSVVGHRPGPGWSIDRVDNRRGYTCGRCQTCTSLGLSLNLRWAERAQQANNRGEITPGTRFDAGEVWAIYRDYTNGHTVTAIARALGVTPTRVSDVLRGNTYGDTYETWTTFHGPLTVRPRGRPEGGSLPPANEPMRSVRHA